MTPNQLIALRAMNGIRYEGFPAVCSFNAVVSESEIANPPGLSRTAAKRAVRQLARMGLAEYSSMFDDDGMICGSGYMLTPAGETAAAEE